MHLDQETRNKLRKFKPGTPVMSKSGGWIGNVVGYHQFETYYDKWESEGRWVYQLRIIWGDSDVEYTVDFADVELL